MINIKTKIVVYSYFSLIPGVLLYGPPGCGKTLIAKATAKASGCRFINLQPSTLTDKWYGESQKLTAAVFSLAVKIQPCIVFIDEIGNYWICSKHLPDISGFQTDKKNITMPACWTLWIIPSALNLPVYAQVFYIHGIYGKRGTYLHNDCNVYDDQSTHCISSPDDIWIILYCVPSSVKLKNVVSRAFYHSVLAETAGKVHYFN